LCRTKFTTRNRAKISHRSSERDWDLLKAILTEDLVWTLPGSSLISGEAKGASAVIQRAKTIVARGVNFEFKHILIGRQGAALSLHNAAQRGAVRLDEHLATVMTMRDGKIAAIDTYLSDIEMLNAFFVAHQ
jgi:ketosteroid isomerase-like protein